MNDPNPIVEIINALVPIERVAIFGGIGTITLGFLIKIVKNLTKVISYPNFVNTVHHPLIYIPLLAGLWSFANYNTFDTGGMRSDGNSSAMVKDFDYTPLGLFSIVTFIALIFYFVIVTIFMIYEYEAGRGFKVIK